MQLVSVMPAVDVVAGSEGLFGPWYVLFFAQAGGCYLVGCELTLDGEPEALMIGTGRPASEEAFTTITDFRRRIQPLHHPVAIMEDAPVSARLKGTGRVTVQIAVLSR